MPGDRSRVGAGPVEVRARRTRPTHLRALALRDTHTDESVAEAIDLLKRELAIDPNYAPAKALVGWSRAHQGSHGRSLPSEAEWV